MKTQPSQRIQAVEAVKGIAIALVVYGHVAQGVNHRGWWDSPAYFFQESFIYSFHMAAFFFASGLFVQSSLARAGAGSFVVQRMRTVLWPYVVCATLGGAISILGLNAAARSREFVHSVLIPALTGEASWFLPTLFVCLLLAMLTNRLPALARFALAAALCMLWPSTGLRIADSAARYFVFLAGGEWVNRRIERLETIPRWAALAGAAAAFGLSVPGNLSSFHDARAMWIALGFAGTLGLFLLAITLRGTVLETAACWCGVASLGIFVLHPFFQGATRILLARLTASHAVLPNVLIPTLVAILGPGLIWHYRDRLHLGFMFAFPWGTPKPSPTPETREKISIASD